MLFQNFLTKTCCNVHPQQVIRFFWLPSHWAIKDWHMQVCTLIQYREYQDLIKPLGMPLNVASIWRNSFLYLRSLMRECKANPIILCGPSSSHQYIENIKKPSNLDTLPYFCSTARNLSSPYWALLILFIKLQHC